jgi:thiosulfate/3-mercaptopyruvate sulfurtransferase
MMKNLLLWMFLILNFVLVACQQVPTKVYQTQSPQTKEADNKAIVVTDQTIIVDARPAFEYSVAHLNGSLPLRPEDFTQREDRFKGLLDLDHFALTRRLARLGISPESQVVVVGRGLQGRGEEGRVAWTLQRLGVKNVDFAALDFFSIPLSTVEAPPRAPVAMWKPQGDETLEVTRRQFLNDSMKPKMGADAVVIIDVRSSEEYLGKVTSSRAPKAPDMGAINVPWSEFFRQNGLVNESVKDRLQAVGISTGQKIYVISHDGMESAAVTMALRELGFSRAANFAGGYRELLFKN